MKTIAKILAARRNDKRVGSIQHSPKADNCKIVLATVLQETLRAGESVHTQDIAAIVQQSPQNTLKYLKILAEEGHLVSTGGKGKIGLWWESSLSTIPSWSKGLTQASFALEIAQAAAR